MNKDMDSHNILTRSKSRKQKEAVRDGENDDSNGDTAEKGKSSVTSPGVSKRQVHQSTMVQGEISTNHGSIGPSCRSSQGKSHLSKHSKSSTIRRKMLEAQIRADEKLAKLLASEQELERRKLATEQEMHKKMLDFERRLIKNRLALQEANIKEDGSMDSSSESRERDLEVPEDMLSQTSRVQEWLQESEEICGPGIPDTFNATTYDKSENKKNNQENSRNQDFEGIDFKKLLARQTIDQELPIFSGEVKEWPNFLNQYNTSTRLLGLCEEENIYRLRKCLKGDARRAVEGLLISGKSLNTVMNILKTRFGRPELIVKCLVNEAKNLSYVKSNDFSTLTHYSDTLQNLVSTLEVMDMQNYLTCPQLLNELLQKLPYSMQLNWGKKLSAKKAEYTLKSFQEWISNEAEGASYVQALLPQKVHPQQVKGKYNTTLVTTDQDLLAIESKRKYTGCGYCKRNHIMEKCEKFKTLSPDDKWKHVKRNNICFSCIKSSHRISSCSRKRKCGVNGCDKFHHYLLHNEKYEKTPKGNEEEENVKEEMDNSTELVAHMSKLCSNEIFLRVAPITIKHQNREVKTYALFDEASTITLIDEEFSQHLGMQGEVRNLGLKWTNKESKKEVLSTKVSFIIAGQDGKEFRLDNVYTLRDMDLPVQTVNAKKFKEKWNHLKNIDFASYTNVTPKLLIGQDHWDLITSREVLEGPKNSPALSRTKLGWILHGNVQQFRGRVDETIVLHIKHRDQEQPDDLHSLVKYFFSIESIGVKIPEKEIMSKEDERAVNLMEKVTKRIGDRWETGLPWKKDKLEFPETRSNAFQRLTYIEKKMGKNQEYATAYENKIQEYIQKGYARKILEKELEECKEKVWYLPHFAVTNENKPGKIRLVFDAASKVEGKSLNDFLLKGPDLFNSLVGILMKFRQKSIAFSSDVKEMFHQVMIRREDQSAQRFLWRENRNQVEPSVFAMEAMIFGAVSSPFSAQYIMHKNALEFKDKFPRAYEAIRYKHYMDDYLDSVDTEEEASQLIEEVIMIQAQGGFKLRGWTSNSKEVLKKIPEELKNTENLLPSEHVLPTEKILGLKWDPNEDIFCFPLNFHKLNKDILTGIKIPTKRDVLKVIMSIYDPIGFLAYYLISGKIILQDIWRSGINWDDEIPRKILNKWLGWLKVFNNIQQLKIPRCYNLQKNRNFPKGNLQLHLFADASEQAFGTVGYFRFDGGEQVQISLVMAKTQVAPLRPMSIPRLELQAALMASRMADVIKNYHEYTIDETFFWTDSRTVLHWIRSESRNYKTFVAHRVGEIQERSDVKDWYWVPTKLNVADDLTRDSEIVFFNLDTRWYKGPEFLYEPYSKWPTEEVKEVENGISEMREEFVLHTAHEEITFLPNMKKFSKWRSLIRSTCLVFKFIRLCKKDIEEKKEISQKNIDESENYWFKKIQEDCFRKELELLKKGKTLEKQSKLYQLSPVLIDGLIRLSGRTDKSLNLSEEAKKPIILDSKHFATKLLIHYYHFKMCHSGTDMVFNELRQRFWIIQARKAIKSTSSYCSICSMRRAMPRIPQMGQLPEFRITMPTSQRAFIYVGVDYFGPYEVTIGRRHEKRYGVIFTCLSIRAVHIEVAESLNTDSALLAVRRFISRRGQPKMIISDNGTNFHSADKELRKSIENIDHKRIGEHLFAQETKWKFIPAASPHMGGAWERMVRSVKTALRITLKERAPRPEVLQTVLLEAEHIINSRPITYVSSSEKDPESLTPNHFLIGTSSIAKPPGLFSEKEWNIRKQWRISQALTEKFWKRWLKEYIPTLTRRTKWFQQVRNLKENDMVVIMDSRLPRNNWPIGRVVKIFPGTDGHVRVADVKVKSIIYRRPVTKICTIECLEMGEETK